MQFTQSQINSGIAITYCSQTAVAHNAVEAVMAINGFQSQAMYNTNHLVCNDFTKMYLCHLFDGDVVDTPTIRTTNCGRYDIKFRPILAHTA